MNRRPSDLESLIRRLAAALREVRRTAGSRLPREQRREIAELLDAADAATAPKRHHRPVKGHGLKPITAAEVDAAIVRHSGIHEGARALGISTWTANARLREAYGSNWSPDRSAAGRVLSQLIDHLGLAAVAAELGAPEAAVASWARRRTMSSAACRAVARLAERTHAEGGQRGITRRWRH